MITAQMLEIILPALAVGFIISLTHAILGIRVLQKGIIFIDLAIAQAAGLGIIFANIYLTQSSSLTTQIIALIFAAGAAFFFYLIERIKPKEQEAIIGCSFVFFASLTMLLLANQPNGGEEITHILSGQILFVTWEKFLSHAPIYAFILALWFGLPKNSNSVRNGLGFYLIFALAITSSVQLVGVYVVFASLILPALGGRNYKKQISATLFCGLISIFLGIISSLIFDLPAGGMIVVSYVLMALTFRFLSR